MHPLPAAEAQRALASWSRFPVDSRPRPVVLISGVRDVLESTASFLDSFGTHVLASGGERTAWAWPGRLRSPHVTRSAGVPARVLAPVNAVLRGSGAASLRVVGAEPAVVPRWTDRGLQDLPGWRIDFAELDAQLLVPDPEPLPHAWLEPGDGELLDLRPLLEPSDGHHARGTGPRPRSRPSPSYRIEDDGRTITMWYFGSDARFTQVTRVEVHANDTAVLLHPVEEAMSEVDFVQDLASGRSTHVTLSEPLGNRVVVNRRGGACVVCRDTPDYHWRPAHPPDPD